MRCGGDGAQIFSLNAVVSYTISPWLNSFIFRDMAAGLSRQDAEFSQKFRIFLKIFFFEVSRESAQEHFLGFDAAGILFLFKREHVRTFELANNDERGGSFDNLKERGCYCGRYVYLVKIIVNKRNIKSVFTTNQHFNTTTKELQGHEVSLQPNENRQQVHRDAILRENSSAYD